MILFVMLSIFSYLVAFLTGISNKNLEELLVKSRERGRASVALESAWLRRGH